MLFTGKVVMLTGMTLAIGVITWASTLGVKAVCRPWAQRLNLTIISMAANRASSRRTWRRWVRWAAVTGRGVDTGEGGQAAAPPPNTL